MSLRLRCAAGGACAREPLFRRSARLRTANDNGNGNGNGYHKNEQSKVKLTKPRRHRPNLSRESTCVAQQHRLTAFVRIFYFGQFAPLYAIATDHDRA